MFGYKKEKKRNKRLDEFDIGKFYIMLAKFNPISDVICVISKDFDNALKDVKGQYDKSYTILANSNTNSIVVVKEDFLKKFLVMNTLQELVDSNFKFSKYI